MLQVSMTALQGFNCNKDLSLLAADMREPCPTEEKTGFIFGWSVLMTVVYAAGIPTVFYLLAKAYKIEQIAKELTSNEYLRALLAAYSHDARALRSVLKRTFGVNDEGSNMQTLSVSCASLLYGIREYESDCELAEDGVWGLCSRDETANCMCPACQKLLTAWKRADIPHVEGTLHVRMLVDKLGLAKGSSELMTVESMMSTVAGFVSDANILLKIENVEDMNEEHLRVLARQDWHTIVPLRKDTCFVCTHSVQVRHIIIG
jgi:hypothetical protein